MEYDKRIQIRYLLELYFDGETTVEQERALREYFGGDDVPADLEYARAMFGFFGSAARGEYPGEVDLQFDNGASAEDGIDAVAAEAVNRAAPDALKFLVHEGGNSVKTAKVRRSRAFGLVFRTVSVAAAVMLTVGVTYTVTRHVNSPTVYCYVNGEPVTDLDHATRQAEMAARLLAGNMKTSAEGISVAADVVKPVGQLGRMLQLMGVEPGGGSAGSDE